MPRLTVRDDAGAPPVLRRRAGLPLAAGLFLLALAGCGEGPQQEPIGRTLADLLAREAPTVEEAERLIAEERFEVARDKLLTLQKSDPENPDAAYLLGEIELRLGNSDAALKHYAAVATLPDHRARALQGQGLALLQLGRQDEALVLLEEAVGLDAGLWRARNALGRIHDARGEWEPAAAAYTQALAANPQSAMLHNNLGMSLLLQRRFDEAMLEFGRAIELDRTLEAPKTNLRMAYALQGRYVEALAGVPEAQIADYLNNVGYAAMLRGDYEGAEAYLTRAMEISPSYHRRAASNLEQLKALKALAAERGE